MGTQPCQFFHSVNSWVLCIVHQSQSMRTLTTLTRTHQSFRKPHIKNLRRWSHGINHNTKIVLEYQFRRGIGVQQHGGLVYHDCLVGWSLLCPFSKSKRVHIVFFVGNLPGRYVRGRPLPLFPFIRSPAAGAV